MKREFLAELAVEEIPPSMAPDIAESFSENFEKTARELGVVFEKSVCFHTPRRFALMVSGVEPKLNDRVVESFGPPEDAAFDKEGSPTAAALGFARSKGVEVKRLEIVRREKGNFLAFRKKIKGGDSAVALAMAVPRAAASIRPAKSMRWKNTAAAFARPIRKISCFFGGAALKISMDGVPFSATVSGHRFAGGKPFKPTGSKNYLELLRKNFVIADPRERAEIIEKNARLQAKKLGGVLRKDPELIETVAGLVEYPLVLYGEFEKRFLALPPEVLTGVMENHQKYFPVFNGSGALMPYFIFVCGTPVKDPKIVVRGNERVLRARFADAEFFRAEDMKIPLEKRVGRLDSMVFLSGAGSYGDKTVRLQKTAEKLAAQTDKKRLSKKLARAAKLSKADLATQMVFEIPELQGTVGKRYAAAEGEDPEVCAAIGEHHMPTARDSALAQTDTGALLAIADKTDTICACFYLGIKPTGSSDPLALRRQAIGLIQTALSKNLDFSISALVDFNLKLLEKAPYSKPPRADLKAVSAEIKAFLAGRFRTVMTEAGAKQDSVEAAISANFENFHDCRKRTGALENARKSADFADLATSFKRVVNIAGGGKDRKVRAELFENSAEKRLWKKICEIEHSQKNQSCKAQLKKISRLKKPVDDFFEKTMVMCENRRVRKNRLAMLGRVKDLFFKIADLSKIETRKH